MTTSDLQSLADARETIPPGEFILDRPLVLGTPGQFTTRHLKGSGRCHVGEASMGGTILRCNFVGPAVNVVMGRNTIIESLSLVGPYYDALKWNYKGPNLSDWPGTSERWHPSAGVAVDASDPPTGSGSSGVFLRDVEISGFAVGVVTHPTGGNVQGEFVSLDHCGINFCGYGVSISQQQNRRLCCREVDFLQVHTVLTNCAHGMQYGFVDGVLHDCHFNTVERLFVLAGSCGTVSFDEGYGELVGSLGVYNTGGHRSATPISIRNLHLCFRTDRPAGLVGEGGGPVAIAGGTIQTFDIAAFGLDLSIEGTRFRPLRYEQGPVSPALRRAVSFTKGHLLPPSHWGTQPWRPHSVAYFPNPAVDFQVGFGGMADPPTSKAYAKSACKYDPAAETIEFPPGPKVVPGDVVQDDDGGTAWVVMSQAGRGWRVERLNNKSRPVSTAGSFWLTQPTPKPR